MQLESEDLDLNLKKKNINVISKTNFQNSP